MTDIRTLLQRATRDLAESGSPSPRLDAEVLLAGLLGIDRIRIILEPERGLSAEETAAYAHRIERRRLGEPVAYILGEKEFWSLRFEVGPEVLIPRPETECLIEEVLRFYSPPGAGLRVIDIGTGSGAIAVVLARELPGARVAATDLSPGALGRARRNAESHGAAGRIAFLPGDLFAGAAGEWDILCSNPPYVPTGEYENLPAGIRDFEPREALVAGPEGLDLLRAIIGEGGPRLKPGGRIFLEIGEGQRDAVEALFRAAGVYDGIAFRKDYGGIDRVASARKRSPERG